MQDNNEKIKITLREVVVSSEEGKSFCDTFIYIPENIDEQKLGNLYIIGEVVNFSNSSSYLINTLASKIKTDFYSNPKRSMMESLEVGLHTANNTLSALANQGKTDWIGNLNMTCSTYKDGKLYISQAGKMKTILIREEKITDIGENIAGQNIIDPLKTFANIASGELESGDLVLFATPELFNIFSDEQLIAIVSSQNIDDVAQTINDAAEKNAEIKTMGVLIMKIEKDLTETLPHSQIKIKPVNDFFDKQNETVSPITSEESFVKPDKKEKKNLSESGISNNNSQKTIKISDNKIGQSEEKLSLEDIIKDYENDSKYKTDNLVQKNFEERDSDDFLASLDEDEKKDFAKVIFRKIGLIFRKLFFLISSPLFFLFKQLIKFKNRKKTDEELYQKISLTSSRKKIIIAFFILVGVFLIGGLIFMNYKHIEDDRFAGYSTLIEQTHEKLAQAEIDIITDKNKARKTLLSAREIINRRDLSLSENNQYTNLNNQTINLLADIQNKLDVIDHVKRIDNPKLTINLSDVKSISNPDKIFEYNKEYFVYDSSKRVIINLDFSKNSVGDLKVLRTDKTKDSEISTLMNKTGEIVFLSGNNSSTIYNIKDKRFLNTNVKLSGFDSPIKDIASYSNFIYTLNPAERQIYKFKKTQAGFNKAVAWLDENDKLDFDLPTGKINNNAISIAVDGSIYVLKANGLIDKYRTGSKQKFAIENLSDSLSDTSIIYTKPNMKYLYIIDKANKRIAIFDKNNGEIVKQFISEKFNDLQNIIVDKKEETIYVLNGKNIFEINMTSENKS